MNDITVIIPTIPGREELLHRAVSSVKNQTCPPAAILLELDTKREGAATTRNRAIAKVNTEWIGFLDDDDEYLPDHLEVCLTAAINTGADLVYPYGDYINCTDPLATAYNGQVVRPFGVPFGPEQEHWLRNVGNFIPVTHLCRASLVKQVGGFPKPNEFPCPDTNISKDCEDFGLLLALLDAGARFHHVPKITWLRHVHDSNTGGI